jgi:hypothetical protein
MTVLTDESPVLDEAAVPLPETAAYTQVASANPAVDIRELRKSFGQLEAPLYQTAHQSRNGVLVI